jgi:hypothetical protein
MKPNSYEIVETNKWSQYFNYTYITETSICFMDISKIFFIKFHRQILAILRNLQLSHTLFFACNTP